ncbi:MAG: Fic family protein [Spirochaetes bacterium]|nr:Fic family protein [Spirochaetota bacterium]
MKRSATGRYIQTSSGDETVRAFVPDPLPPQLSIGPDLREQLDQALLSLGRLSGSAVFLPDSKLLLYLYVRKEAVLSSQIEGTQSSLSDLLLFEIDEAPGVPLADVAEVSRYVAAVEHGIARMRSGFPLSNRLLREVHAVLLAKGRGSDKDPGNFRGSQNWIGGLRPALAAFVPPPVEHVEPCMADLELFLHDKPTRTPALIKAALAHVQFETIHPFLDGNGRLGRLLISLILCADRILEDPILFLSLYFKNHRQRYYDLLQAVRVEGDWEGWLEFFACAVRETADQCAATAEKTNRLSRVDRAKILGFGRIAGSATLVHQELLAHPLTTIARMSKASGLVPNTVRKVFAALSEAGIVREITGKRRNRLFAYGELLDTMDEGTKPL